MKLYNDDEAYRSLLVWDPITDNISDLGLTKFADDRKRTHVVVTGTKEEIEVRITHSTVFLDEELLEGRVCTNGSRSRRW